MTFRQKRIAFKVSIALSFLSLMILGMVLAGSGEKANDMRTIEVTPEKVNMGKTLFAACGACHGQSGEGRIGMGPRLNSRGFLAAASDKFLVETIAKGRSGTTMIPWGMSYKTEQIESIVAYMRSLNPVPPAKLDESSLKGSDFHGKAVWDSICAACHGNSGAGYMETANGTGIGRKAFLDTASNGYLRYIINNGKDQTMMRGFAKKNVTAVANLSDQEIEDVIVYLRKNAW